MRSLIPIIAAALLALCLSGCDRQVVCECKCECPDVSPTEMPSTVLPLEQTPIPLSCSSKLSIYVDGVEVDEHVPIEPGTTVPIELDISVCSDDYVITFSIENGELERKAELVYQYTAPYVSGMDDVKFELEDSNGGKDTDQIEFPVVIMEFIDSNRVINCNPYLPCSYEVQGTASGIPDDLLGDVAIVVMTRLRESEQDQWQSHLMQFSEEDEFWKGKITFEQESYLAGTEFLTQVIALPRNDVLTADLSEVLPYDVIPGDLEMITASSNLHNWEITSDRAPLSSARDEQLVSISSPFQYSRISLVPEKEFTVKGSALGVKPGSELWVLVYDPSIGEYYPQTLSECPEISPLLIPQDGNWEYRNVRLRRMNADIEEAEAQFDMVVVSADSDSEASAFFHQYFEEHYSELDTEECKQVDFRRLGPEELPPGLQEEAAVTVIGIFE